MSRVRSRIGFPFLLVLVLGVETSAQSTEVVSLGDTISFASFGDGATTILLVHGWSNTRTFWEPHLSTLAGQYKVVTVDLASFGESTGHRSDWTMATFADDVDAVLEQIDAEEVVVVGFSMGGAAAIELASRGRQELIGVVLVDILHDVDWSPTDAYIDQVLAAERDTWHDPAALREAFSPGASEALVRRYISRTPETVPESWWASLRGFFVWVRADLRPTLGEVDVPIRAINADEPPTTTEAWQRYAPGFSAHVLGDVGHLGSMWERVEQFDDALIGFLEDFRASGGR